MIRLQRVGRKNVPLFRVVLTDSKNSTKSGKYLEALGSYNPKNVKERVIDADRVKYWMSKGAKLSDTLHNYLVHTKVISGKKINVLPRKSPIKKEEVVKEEKAEAPAEEAKAEEVPKETAPVEASKA